MLDDINRAIDSFGGQWVNLRKKTDGVLDGLVVSVEERDKTFEGAVVLSRKTQQPRREWVFVLKTERHETDEDDGVRKFAANESAQRAIAKAVKESGRKLEVNGRLKVVVTTDPENDRDQAEYKAKYEAPAPIAATVSAAVEVDDLL